MIRRVRRSGPCAWTLLPLLAACAASGDPVAPSGGGAKSLDDDDLFGCEAAPACDGTTAVTCAADGSSTRTDCAAMGKQCAAGLGCVACIPGDGASCQGGVGVACRHDGSGMMEFACDPVQGMVCEPDGCKGACSPGTLGPSYIGCDYWPTTTLNTGLFWSGFTFAVAIGNTTELAADVTITRGDAVVKTVSVAANDLEIVPLDWVPELRGPEVSLTGSPQVPPVPSVVADGSYRLRTTQPVTVYQFSPLAYEISPAPAECPVGSQPGCFSYSNDASLLLPAHVLGHDYMSVAWATLGCRTGFVAITATEDGTEIELDGVGDLEPGAGIDENGEGKAHLDAGDVVQLTSRSTGGPFCFNAPGGDISGTRVRASRPVQVIAGHACANLPTPETQACDHLEEAMFPVETLGRDYLVTVPASTEGGVSPHTIRVVGVEDGTTVVFDPAIHEPTKVDAGQIVELRYVEDDVHVSADRPVLVSQFMQGSDSVPDHAGDPSQSLAVPSEQFRTDYVFLAPDSYDQNWVNVVAPVGAPVVLDGQTLPEGSFVPVAATGLAVARVALSKTEMHRASSVEPFGITVYGYGVYTSFMYPGGLDLAAVSVPTPK